MLGVFVLRWRQPALPRPYRTWGYPVTPLIFLAISGWMLAYIAALDNPRRIAGWPRTLLVGLIVYFVSRQARRGPNRERRP